MKYLKHIYTNKQVIKKKLLFIWKSNLTRRPVLYLATLVLGRVIWPPLQNMRPHLADENVPLGLLHGITRLAMVMVKGKELNLSSAPWISTLSFTLKKYCEKHFNVFLIIQSGNGLVVLNKEYTSFGSLGFVCVGAKSLGLTVWIYETRELVSLARFASPSEE